MRWGAERPLLRQYMRVRYVATCESSPVQPARSPPPLYRISPLCTSEFRPRLTRWRRRPPPARPRPCPAIASSRVGGRRPGRLVRASVGASEVKSGQRRKEQPRPRPVCRGRSLGRKAVAVPSDGMTRGCYALGFARSRPPPPRRRISSAVCPSASVSARLLTAHDPF